MVDNHERQTAFIILRRYKTISLNRIRHRKISRLSTLIFTTRSGKSERNLRRIEVKRQKFGIMYWRQNKTMARFATWSKSRHKI